MLLEILGMWTKSQNMIDNYFVSLKSEGLNVEINFT